MDWHNSWSICIFQIAGERPCFRPANSWKPLPLPRNPIVCKFACWHCCILEFDETARVRQPGHLRRSPNPTRHYQRLERFDLMTIESAIWRLMSFRYWREWVIDPSDLHTGNVGWWNSQLGVRQLGWTCGCVTHPHISVRLFSFNSSHMAMALDQSFRVS